MATSEKGTSIASENLKKGLSSPVAKVGLAVFGFVLIIVIGATVMVFRNNATKAGAAEASNFGVDGTQPRGSVDTKTARAVEANANAISDEARKSGSSYGGPFVFEGANSNPSAPGAATDITSAGASGSEDGAPARSAPLVIADLRSKAVEYDATEQQSSRGASSQSNNSGGSGGSSSRNAGQQGQGGATGYGVGEEAFKQIAKQLEQVGAQQVRYESLPNGILNKPPVPVISERGELASSKSGAAAGKKSSEVVAQRAGDICPASLEATVNTDYNAPIFAELIECGVLTGARVKGLANRTPDDFTIRFSNMTLDPKKGFKLVDQIESLAVNISKDGAPGVADDVNNHWVTRLGSSALMALGKTERSFIQQRGSSTINTGTSTSTSIDPLSSQEKRDARLGAVLEGSMDVVSRDLAVGINRQPTMTLNRTTAIGVQFMSDVKVVPNE